MLTEHFTFCVFPENKPLPGDDRDLPQRFSGKKPEPHAEAFSQRLQHLPQNVVPSCRVSSSHRRFFPPSFDRLNVLTPYLIVLRSYSDFQAYTRARKNKTYICKPDTGSQGKGIFISKSSKNVLPGEHMICQVYISRVRVLLSQSHTLTQTHTHTHCSHSFLLSPPQPFILGGYKFDLRIYVLVTSCDPFSVFMFKEGLVRFCTTKYHEPTNSNVVRNVKSSVFSSLSVIVVERLNAHTKKGPLPRI